MNVFITGIAGTIGAAFTELLCRDNIVSGIDRNETSVAKLLSSGLVMDVKTGDFEDIDFATTKADVLIHLAAMKHVDLCEKNPNSCVRNNIVKTLKLFDSAHKNGVSILFMSTDKAVEPISVYGYSKAIMEAVAFEYGGSVVRSGNVLGSNGSVLTIWEDAIMEGQPIRITDERMKRFFITPKSLVNQVWENYDRENPSLIVPEMDEEVRLIDLATEKLAQRGFTLENYPGGVIFTGKRAGEKLTEKLYEEKK